MKNIGFKKLLSTVTLCALSSFSLCSTGVGSAGGGNGWFSGVGQGAVETLLSDSAVQDFLKAATSALKNADVKALNDLANGVLDKTSGFISKWEIYFQIFGVGLVALTASLAALAGMSVLSSVWNFGRYLLGYGKEKKIETYADVLRDVKKAIDSLPVEDELKLGLYTSIIQQFAAGGLRSVPLTTAVTDKRVVIAGSGNALLFQSLADELKKIFSLKCKLPVVFKKIRSEDSTSRCFFEEVCRASAGDGEYEGKGGIYIFVYDGEIDLLDKSVRELKRRCASFYFEFKRAFGRIACALLQRRVRETVSLAYANASVGLVFGKDILVYIFNKYNDYVVPDGDCCGADMVNDIAGDVNNVCGAVVSFVNSAVGDDRRDILSGRRTLQVDRNVETGDVEVALLPVQCT